MSVIDTFRLNGRRALVTGSSMGIGFAIAQALASAGAHVVLNARTRATLDQAHDQLAAQGLAVSSQCFDVTDANAVREAIAHIEDQGPLDILVNNAGIQIRAPLDQFADDDWRRLMATNLDSVYYVSKAVAQRMLPRQRGSIINLCSVMSEVSRPTVAPYTASKGGVKMLTKAMANDWGPHGIRVNGIGPGFFKTELNEKLVNDPKFSAWIEGRTPSRRWGELEDLGPAAVYLASDASRFVNVHVLYVDGGLTAAL
ncbi:MAG: glucose 1-dehydrogenase [Betaproteobacteria bacterium]